MIDTNQFQELAEGVIMAALNGGGLVGFVFHHDDASGRTRKDQITVKAGAPEPQLEGPRGQRVEVSIEIRTSKPTRGAALHGEALQRLTSLSVLVAAALEAGLAEKDDLYLMDEEITGDRVETKNLRKRNIVVPLVMRINPIGAAPVVLRSNLVVTPTAGLLSSGVLGGPFTPGNKVYTLVNSEVGQMVWEVVVDVDWLSVSVATGTLAGGANTTVTISVNAQANALAESVYLGVITFRNKTAGQTFTRGVGLVVGSSGESMPHEILSFNIPNATQTFDIPFADEYDTPPAWVELQILNPDGEPVILPQPPVWDTDKVTVILDVPTGTIGYVAKCLVIPT